MNAMSFALDVDPPFNLGLTIMTLRRSVKNATDIWAAHGYRRVLILDDEPHAIAVRQLSTTKTPQLQVTITSNRPAVSVQARVTLQLTRMLGLAVNLKPFYRHIADDAAMRTLTEPFVGMRPPRLASAYETLVAAIACQQVSLTAGITFLNRLAGAFGQFVDDGGRAYAFPTPGRLADLAPAEIRQLGFSEQKTQTLLRLSREVAEGGLRLDECETMDDDQVRQRLLAIKGIGPWTADYFLLRGMGRLHVFPRNDSGALNGLAGWLNLGHKPNPKELERILAPRQPYAGMIYFHLLLRKLIQQQTMP